MKWNYLFGMSLAGLLLVNAEGRAQMRITEWMYNNTPEFVEFTNVGPSPIDMTGWSFDDSDPAQGVSSLSAFGSVASHESVVITEDTTAAAFRTKWSLAESVKVIAGITNNLGRSDEINLYNDLSAVVDKLTYNDQGTGNVHGPRTQDISGNIPFTALGTNNASLAVSSTVGDSYGSYANNLSPVAQIGNPGYYSPVAVPEPASIVLLIMGAMASAFRRKR